MEAQQEAFARLEKWKKDPKHHNFLPKSLLEGAADLPIALNVGGQSFQCSRTLLRKDPDSLLCALTDSDSPLLADMEEGAAVACFDRDWWLFRYILAFLRDGTVPRDKEMLKRLYQEAVYWNLTSLQRKIEEGTMSVYRRDMGVQGSEPGQLTEAEYKLFQKALKKRQGRADTDPDPLKDADWWDTPPEWWGVSKDKKKETAHDEENVFKYWWDSSTYEHAFNGHSQYHKRTSKLDFETLEADTNKNRKYKDDDEKAKLKKKRTEELDNKRWEPIGKKEPFDDGHHRTLNSAVWPRMS
jgi:hypothetical protein